ncbi:hypothetical protein GJ744_001437 [Endocarpon pusillum]|uniref:Uncharacterized protein n=1 Tax=Endocarpon pusillum TaxID=364733 RepID=A0A8H7E7V7_9EURO|nr:hypothetical protein GJ744_001437 [Endocarpon pusillum]
MQATDHNQPQLYEKGARIYSIVPLRIAKTDSQAHHPFLFPVERGAKHAVSTSRHQRLLADDRNPKELQGNRKLAPAAEPPPPVPVGA